MAPMQTVFIAVQCCKCSTMQVKQRKKSSNKWICVVCNQKQSVRQVFAQGFMAKDVRKFVQNFNMSRQFSEQQFDLAEHEEAQTLEAEDRFPSNRNNKRTDWTEYLDFEDESIEKEDEQSIGDELESRIVTELPKAVFKRPKLSNNCAGSEKRDTRKQSTLQGKGSRSVNSAEAQAQAPDIPSWSENRDDNNLVSKEPTTAKWSEYLTTDADDDNLELERLPVNGIANPN